jgi:hypothetical protein
MMDDSKGRCQHEKIVEPCRPQRIAPGGGSERRLEKE